MQPIEALSSAKRPILTDGGMETWQFFREVFEAPEFAAITLMEDPAFRSALRAYFDRFLALAEAAGTGYVLDTNTWRGCTVWADKLGMSEAELLELSREAVKFSREVRDDWQDRVQPIVLNRVIGPSGDGYAPRAIPTAQEAQALHAPQIGALAEGGVDMLSAIAMTNVGEAIGIVRAAKDVDLPVVISFTVETDGKLPSRDLLGEAIEAVDAATEGYAAYYMVNCAHPDHFRDVLAEGEGWLARIGGLRANASRMSHEELDNAEELDDGDPDEFGVLHSELAKMLPSLRVVGGCCGTDHRHVECVSRELHLEGAA